MAGSKCDGQLVSEQRAQRLISFRLVALFLSTALSQRARREDGETPETLPHPTSGHDVWAVGLGVFGNSLKVQPGFEYENCLDL